MMRIVLSALLAMLPFASAPGAVPSAAGASEFADFFLGTTYGEGEVRVPFAGPDPFTSRFAGRMEGDVLVIVEDFAFSSGPASQTWRLRPTGSGRYAGTVTGGATPVEVRIDDGRAVIAYRGTPPGREGPVLRFRHVIAFENAGLARNRVVASKFGLPIVRSSVTFAKDRALLREATR